MLNATLEIQPLAVINRMVDGLKADPAIAACLAAIPATLAAVVLFFAASAAAAESQAPGSTASPATDHVLVASR